MKVQVPTYSSAWRRGERTGEVIEVIKTKSGMDLARIALDRTDKVVGFWLKDCQEVQS
jgi:hypothetical protein